MECVLFLGMDDPEWGQRLVTLVQTSDSGVLEQLAAMTAEWPASDRPRRWVLCPELAPTDAGKWQRQAWRDWLKRLDLAQGRGFDPTFDRFGQAAAFARHGINREVL